MKTRYKIIGIFVVGIVTIIVGLSVASPSINNLDDLLYQLEEPFDGPEPEQVVISLPSDHPIITYNGTNCSPAEILNNTCFVDSFTKCTNARISKTIVTIEGDPITTFALVNSTLPEMCKIDVYRNDLQDRYGNQEITHHICSLIIESDRSLQVTSCIPLEHGQEQIFEFEKSRE